MVREAFPQARVYEPKSYVKFALGGKLELVAVFDDERILI